MSNFLLRLGVAFRQQSADPNEVFVCCPFCPERGETPDSRFRLGLNLRSGLAHCFNCGWRGRPGPQTLRYVLRRLGIAAQELPTEFETEQVVGSSEALELPADFMPLTRCYDQLDRRARNYLLQRGVTKEQIRRHNIGVSYSGRYAYRIVFPVVEQERLVGIVARDFTGHREPRYLNSRGEKHLYAGRAAQRVVLSEGVFKCLRLEQALRDTEYVSMALLGHDITETQLQQLQSFGCRRVLLWPDPDTVGVRGMVTVAEKLLQAGLRVRFMLHVRQPADEVALSEIQESYRGFQAPVNWALLERLRASPQLVKKGFTGVRDSI